MTGNFPLLIASDHAGFALKQELQKLLTQPQWIDLGPENTNRVDYPDYAQKLALAIKSGRAPLGILICGSGIGMSIAANKIQGIRAAAVENPSCARLAREHNDANVLCLGGRFLAPPYAAEIAEAWLGAQFQGGRHAERIEKTSRLLSLGGSSHES